MSFIIRQSTQITAMLGPFLDATDGVTEEVGLAGGGTELSKNGGAYATGPTLGTHDAEGWYPITLTTTHTNTVGRLRIKSQAAATHLPVWLDLQVIEEAVFDSLFAASGAGYATAAGVWASGTRTLTAATNLTTALATPTNITAGTIATVSGNVNGSVGSVTGAVGSVTGAVGSLTGHTVQTGDSFARLGAPAGASVSADVAAIKTETATILADTGELQTNQGNWVTAVGFSTHSAADVWTAVTRTLTASTNFNDPTAAAIADAVWDEAQSGHVSAGTFGLYVDTEVSGVGGGTAASIADAVWDEAQSGHVSAGTFGAYLDAAISGVGGAVGTGADAVTLTILEDDASTPIADADVWISTDSAGSNVTAGPLQTNSLGKATFMLDATVTYYRWVQKDGINFTNPTSFVAVAD